MNNFAKAKRDILNLMEKYEKKYRNIRFDEYPMDYQETINAFTRIEMLKLYGYDFFHSIEVEHKETNLECAGGEATNKALIWAINSKTGVKTQVAQIECSDKTMIGCFFDIEAARDYKVCKIFWEELVKLKEKNNPEVTRWSWEHK